MELAVTPHKTDELTAQVISTDPGVITTLGLEGGHPGHPGNFIYVPGGVAHAGGAASGVLPATRSAIERSVGTLNRVSPKAVIKLRPGDIWVVENSAGGGLGDPLSRDAERVKADVAGRRVSTSAASRFYGVVLDNTDAIDHEATRHMREGLIRARLEVAKPPRLPSEGRRMAGIRAVGDGIGIAGAEGAQVWCCMGCEKSTGSVATPYKSFARVAEIEPHEIDPVMYADAREYCDDRIVLRQFYCSACGHLWATEVARAADDPLDDVMIEPDLPVDATLAA